MSVEFTSDDIPSIQKIDSARYVDRVIEGSAAIPMILSPAEGRAIYPQPEACILEKRSDVDKETELQT